MEIFNPENFPKTLAYVKKYDTGNRRCNRCGCVVLIEPQPMDAEYPYQCMSCDENRFGIETHLGNPHTEEGFRELCRNTKDLLFLDA